MVVYSCLAEAVNRSENGTQLNGSGLHNDLTIISMHLLRNDMGGKQRILSDPIGRSSHLSLLRL